MAAISQQVKERSSSINVLTVLTLILVDSVGGHPTDIGCVAQLFLSLPKISCAMQTPCSTRTVVVVVHRFHVFEYFCWSLSSFKQ